MKPDTEKLLFVKSRRASFIELDQQLLAERYAVTELYQPGKFTNPLRTLRQVLAADLIVGWWASWHTFVPFTLAWLLRKPSLLIIGGFDTAAEPEYGYGYQLGGIRKYLSRWIMHRAGRLMTNSEYSRAEIERNVGIPAARVSVVYHGIPDTTGQTPAAVKRPLALTVGILDTTNLTRKGLEPFVRAAALLPEVEFVLAGRPTPEAERVVREIATPNVRIAGYVPDAELEALMDEAAVYVQASRHEGFGVSVAEAMLHGCIPVATGAGALPETVGQTGVIIADSDPETVACGIRSALALAERKECREAARKHVQSEFSLDQRRDGLLALTRALHGGGDTL